MSGTPTGLATLILAEVYDLDRELLTSSITLTLVGLLLVLLFWVRVTPTYFLAQRGSIMQASANFVPQILQN
jgi:hypothetical protein